MLIYLDLRKVCVESDICSEVLGDPVLHIQTEVAVTDVAAVRVTNSVPGDAANGVWLDFDVSAGRWGLDAHQRAGRRHPKNTGTTTAPGRNRKTGQIDPLVFPTNRTAKLHAPHLRRSGPVTERLEWNFHLDGPATIEPSGSHIPDGIPIAVRVAFVRELRVGPRAERVRVEIEPIAPVVKSVEEHGEGVVIP